MNTNEEHGRILEGRRCDRPPESVFKELIIYEIYISIFFNVDHFITIYSLQTPKANSKDLLSEVKHIQSLKSSLISMRISYEKFELIFKNTENVFVNYNIIIPPIQNRKIPKK
jgi:hypothetical protein